MPHPISPATLARRARAASLGVTDHALRQRDDRLRRKALPPPGSEPRPATWIGRRLWPPLEAGHPAHAPEVGP